jgi:membrane protein YqaA with SNARE-associated domain
VRKHNGKRLFLCGLTLWQRKHNEDNMSVLIVQPAQSPVPRVHHPVLPHWLTHLGPLGLFAVAVFDSSAIPLPIPGSTDLLLLWLVAHSGDPWLLVASAVTGSILGGYTTWRLGRRGGEAALRRYVPARFVVRVTAWVEHHPVLAVFLPAVLPPPIPLSPFILAAGALGVSRNRFLTVFGAARTVRYSLIAWLAVTYGRKVVRMWSGTLQAWSAPLLWTFGAVMLCGICFGVWKARNLRNADSAETREMQASAGRVA